MMKQAIFDDYEKFKSVLEKAIKHKKCLLVCARPQDDNYIVDWLKKNSDGLVEFNEFSTNPKIEEALLGSKIFCENKCDFLISLGGGSAIDVAKVIKVLLGEMNDQGADFDEAKIRKILDQPCLNKRIMHLAIPTTAGTGSESTHFAVIYYKGVKYSVAAEEILPNYVLLQPELLATLPDYQKKSTMLDALCQGIESYWSVKSTEESKQKVTESIEIILGNYNDYINMPFDEKIAARILKAANLSGQAINISQTTAAHAMSYKITSLYGLAHGHAVAVCLPWVWKYMLSNMSNMDLVIDKRGESYVAGIMNRLARLFGVDSGDVAIDKMFEIYKQIGVKYEHVVKLEDVDTLVNSVNLQRLGNNPVKLNSEALRQIYLKLV